MIFFNAPLLSISRILYVTEVTRYAFIWDVSHDTPQAALTRKRAHDFALK